MLKLKSKNFYRTKNYFPAWNSKMGKVRQFYCLETTSYHELAQLKCTAVNLSKLKKLKFE